MASGQNRVGRKEEGIELLPNSKAGDLANSEHLNPKLKSGKVTRHWNFGKGCPVKKGEQVCSQHNRIESPDSRPHPLNLSAKFTTF